MVNAKELKTYFIIEQFDVRTEEKIESRRMRGDEILNWAQNIYQLNNGYRPSSRISLRACYEIISEEVIGYLTFTRLCMRRYVDGPERFFTTGTVIDGRNRK